MANGGLMQQRLSAVWGDEMAVFESFPSRRKQQRSISKTEQNHSHDLISITELAMLPGKDY
jgi:hypothetical protein